MAAFPEEGMLGTVPMVIPDRFELHGKEKKVRAWRTYPSASVDE